MKAKPAVFLGKPIHYGLMALMLTASLAHGQGYPPAGSGLAAGAIQQPYYRQPGSSYVPPGPTASPAKPSGYQQGFGTAPKLPAVKSTSAKPKSTSSTTTKKPASLETKVARLEQNDAHQDRRLNSLERGGSSGVQTIEGGGLYTPSEGHLYTVRPGDTLWRIADKHSTSINAIKSVNRISGETISVGQTIMIPGHGSSGVTESFHSGVHIVRPGDTFSEIAQASGVSQDALARANPSAYPDRLLIGERLTIPGKKSLPSSGYYVPAGGGATVTTTASKTHMVKKGESLGAIAKSYGIPTATLASANKLKNANLIAPGQRLIIPGTRTTRGPTPSYPPADTDTTPLPGAGLYATPAPSPMAAPEPAPQPIAKPTPPASTNSRGIVAYRLERGDDINTVANLFNTTPEKIRELNKMSADAKIREGDEVVVPSLGAVSLN